MKILVVDDEWVILELLEGAFKEQGFEVQTAGSAEEALPLLEAGEFAVMFLDLKLPGMDGLELCRKIRKRFPKARIYAMTGYPSKFEFSKCREASFDGYFTKPLDPVLLVNVAKGEQAHG